MGIYKKIGLSQETGDIDTAPLEKMGKVREFQNFPLNGMAKAVF